LPPPAFSRGYLRAYAKLLALDPDVIVRAFDSALGHTGGGQAVRFNTMAPAKGGVAEMMQKQPGTVLTGAVALVICGVVVVLWAVWPDVSGTLKAERSGTTKPPAEVANAVSKSGSESTPKAGAVTPAVVQSAPPTATPGVAARTEPGAVEQAAKQGAEAGGPRRITETGDDRLTFAFTQDCWVEVKDRQGRNIYSELSRSGESLELIGQAPFMIMLGYAPGVTLSFNGERVTLTPHTRNNVATLALGQ
jgi:cytoskeleton protein RodZ